MSAMTATGATSEIDNAIDRALAEKRIVGAVVLVMQDGQTAYRRAAGLADREGGIAMREQALFRLASVSKPIVTATALRLVELGMIALADPVTRFLPKFRPALPDGEAPTITLRHLMTHTAGLSYGFLQPPDGSYSRAGVSDGLEQPGLAMADELDRIARAGLAYRPGERWAYSVAIDVLGAVLAAAEGRDLDAVVTDHIAKPLGWLSTGFDIRPGQRDSLAANYADGVPEPVRIPDDGMRVHFPAGVPQFEGLAGVDLVPARIHNGASFRSGGAGMVGTAGDVLAFVEAIRTGGGPILERASANAMLTVQTGDMQIPQRGPGWAFGYGGALLADPAAAQSPQSRGAFGWGGVWGHSWFIDPVKKLSVVSLSNTALEGMMGRFTRDVRDAVYTEIA
jgi:CubicO group peptidase (beta-lactamase class C family)